MAAIGNATILYDSDSGFSIGPRVLILGLRRVNQNDTIDLAAVPRVGLLGVIYSAAIICTTNRSIAAAALSVVGTVATLTAAYANDDVVIMVVGSAPQ